MVMQIFTLVMKVEQFIPIVTYNFEVCIFKVAYNIIYMCIYSLLIKLFT